MSGKIEISRELAERMVDCAESYVNIDDADLITLRKLLAAPVVERQEPADREQWWADTPDGDSALVTRVAAQSDSLALERTRSEIKALCKHPSMSFHQLALLEGILSISSQGTSPPAPVSAVKPVVWRIPVNGDWFYGTKEQCEREYAEYIADFTEDDFDEDGPAKPEPLACLDKVKGLNS